MGVLISPLGSMGECDTLDGTVYLIYVGEIGGPVTVTQIRAAITAVAIGTSATEMGVYTSNVAPSIAGTAGATFTRIAAAAVTGDITSDNSVNAVLTGATISAGSHVWLAFRSSMSGAGADQPKMIGVGTDHGLGLIATKSSVTDALTHSSNATITGVALPDATGLTPVAVNMGAEY